MECESEWSQHKKIIDTTGRGLKRSIPEGFPYFNIEFGIDSGYAHVIEDEKKFSRYLGRVGTVFHFYLLSVEKIFTCLKSHYQEVIAGMLQIDPDRWLRPHNESPIVIKQRVQDFLKWWQPYDWTQQLDGGEF